MIRNTTASLWDGYRLRDFGNRCFRKQLVSSASQFRFFQTSARWWNAFCICLRSIDFMWIVFTSNYRYQVWSYFLKYHLLFNCIFWFQICIFISFNLSIDKMRNERLYFLQMRRLSIVVAYLTFIDCFKRHKWKSFRMRALFAMIRGIIHFRKMKNISRGEIRILDTLVASI